jgi:hypothetical protein
VGNHFLAEGVKRLTVEVFPQPSGVVYQHDFNCKVGPVGRRNIPPAIAWGVLRAVKIEVACWYLGQGVAAVSVASQNPRERAIIPCGQHRHRKEGGGGRFSAGHRLLHCPQQGLGRVLRVELHGSRPAGAESIVRRTKDPVRYKLSD